MVLITGGAYQGKLEFAKEIATQRFGACEECNIADGAVADFAQLKTAHIINHLHLWIARLLKEEKNPAEEIEHLVKENPGVVLVGNELGCGIVPVDAFDRNWREVTGRICCSLAKEAEAVYRVTCGIGVELRKRKDTCTV